MSATVNEIVFGSLITIVRPIVKARQIVNARVTLIVRVPMVRSFSIATGSSESEKGFD